LRLRGAGDFFGTRQAGVPTFRLIDLVRDHQILELAQQEAAHAFQSSPAELGTIAQVLRAWEERFRLVEIG
jgi:ATP-dependent DNA helicase RecG